MRAVHGCEFLGFWTRPCAPGLNSNCWRLHEKAWGLAPEFQGCTHEYYVTNCHEAAIYNGRTTIHSLGVEKWRTALSIALATWPTLLSLRPAIEMRPEETM